MSDRTTKLVEPLHHNVLHIVSELSKRIQNLDGENCEYESLLRRINQ